MVVQDALLAQSVPQHQLLQLRTNHLLKARSNNHPLPCQWLLRFMASLSAIHMVVLTTMLLAAFTQMDHNTINPPLLTPATILLTLELLPMMPPTQPLIKSLAVLPPNPTTAMAILDTRTLLSNTGV